MQRMASGRVTPAELIDSPRSPGTCSASTSADSFLATVRFRETAAGSNDPTDERRDFKALEGVGRELAGAGPGGASPEDGGAAGTLRVSGSGSMISGGDTGVGEGNPSVARAESGTPAREARRLLRAELTGGADNPPREAAGGANPPPGGAREPFAGGPANPLVGDASLLGGARALGGANALFGVARPPGGARPPPLPPPGGPSPPPADF
jgi:hypothetical protein